MEFTPTLPGKNTLKTCSGRVEERNNLQAFVEELSLALFDPELLRGGYDGEEHETKLRVRDFLRDKVRSKGVRRALSYLAEIQSRVEAENAKKTSESGKVKAERSNFQRLESDGFESVENYASAFSADTHSCGAMREVQRAYEMARKEAWNDVKKLIASGKLRVEDVNTLEFLDTFDRELSEEMEKFGFVSRKGQRKIFTGRAEKAIARRALEIALRELKSKLFGSISSLEERNFFPSNPLELVEYDDLLHCFDMLDIQESLVNELLLSGRLELGNHLLARNFEKTSKVSFFILIDTSDSMRGEKLRGAVRAALAVKAAAEKLSRELKVFAFNHRVTRLREGEIVNVVARGRTNVAQALLEVVRTADRENSSPVVFLITDGEPTSPDNPLAKALMAAEKLGKLKESRLILMMLNNDSKYEEFCMALTSRVKNSVFLRLRPDDLSLYVLREFLGFSF